MGCLLEIRENFPNVHDINTHMLSLFRFNLVLYSATIPDGYYKQGTEHRQNTLILPTLPNERVIVIN